MEKNEAKSEDFGQLADLEKRLEEIKTRSADFIQKHPLTSVAIAVGVGYVIAKLFSGKRS
jgi:ElaB/YqjD/DUF883 family membrane-anchored ribosome-binding protein